MELIGFINIVMITLSSSGIGWYWNQNLVLQIIREKLRIKWSECEYCTAFIICFISLILSGYIYYIGFAGISAYIANKMVKDSNKITL